MRKSPTSYEELNLSLILWICDELFIWNKLHSLYKRKNRETSKHERIIKNSVVGKKTRLWIIDIYSLNFSRSLIFFVLVLLFLIHIYSCAIVSSAHLIFHYYTIREFEVQHLKKKKIEKMLIITNGLSSHLRAKTLEIAFRHGHYTLWVQMSDVSWFMKQFSFSISISYKKFRTMTVCLFYKSEKDVWWFHRPNYGFRS